MELTSNPEAAPYPANKPEKTFGIEELESEIRQLESGSYFKGRDARRIIALKRSRNRQTPIGKLPPEILSAIIRANATESSQHYKDLHRYAMVSKFWWNTIVHTPQLWYLISADLNLKVNEMIVRRAPSTPLWVISEGHSKRQMKKVEAFMRFACNYAERWGSLMYKEKFLAEDLKRALPQAFGLFDIRLIVTKPKGSGAPPTITLHPDSRISDPVFMGVELTQPDMSVTGTDIICLEWIPKLPSLQWFLDLPDKKSLYWLHIRSSSTISSTRISTTLYGTLSPPLVLPVARKIVLRRMPRDLLLEFVTRLSAPRCQELEITPDIPASLFGNARFRQLVAAPLRSRHSRTSIRLTYWTTTGALEIYTARKELKAGTTWWPAADFGEISPPKESSCPDYYIRTILTNRRDWKHIVSLLNTEVGDRPVYLTLNHGTAAGAGMLDDTETPLPRLDILRDAPRVEVLTAVGAREALPILRYLSHPCTNGSGELQWPFPRLHCFRFVKFGEYDREELIELLTLFVRLRHGRGRAEADIPSLPRPVPLAKIVGPKKLCRAFQGRKEFDGIIISHDYAS